MKNVVRALAALAVVALATPALACEVAKKETTAAAQQQKQSKEKKAAQQAGVKTAQAPAKPATAQQN